MISLSQRIAMLEEECCEVKLTEEQQERLHNIFEPFMTDERKAKSEALIKKIGPAPDTTTTSGKLARRKWLIALFMEGQENIQV